MNLLYIHTHDMGRFNGIYGYSEVTPNMVKFSKDSCVFQDAHCASPTCSPSRGCLLTGMLPHSNGLTGLAHRGFSMQDPSHHLSHYLKSHGYHTVLCGIQHETEDVSTLGYDEVYVQSKQEKNQHRDEYTVQHATEFLKHAKNPFFLSVGFGRPHRPYDTYSEIDPDYVEVPSCLPDVKEVREDIADYLTTLQKADTCIGKVLDSLKENNLYENTMVILTTDHGVAFPFMKNTLYDTGTRVTLAIRLPGKMKIRRTDALVSQLDVFPTICDAMKLPKPEYLQGNSLMDILHGDKEWVQDEIYAEMNFHCIYEPGRSIRTKRYKYICRYDDSAYYKIQNVDNGKTKHFLMENNLAEKRIESNELYDLYLDPYERNNLILEPSYRKIYTELKEKLSAHMQRTEDPLLVGPMTPPIGARLD